MAAGQVPTGSDKALRSEGLGLRTERLGPLPLLNRFVERLGLAALLERHVATKDRRSRVPHAKALGVLLRSVLVEREPIYRQHETVATFAPQAFGLTAEEALALGDDHVGRALDRLFDADRGTLATEVVLAAAQAFDVVFDELHNDSTSITFTGDYTAATGRLIRGKKALRITHGYNKDHRPDLKQLLWVLTVSADGAVPLHYRVCDGNTNDDPTHIETWDALCKLAGKPDFVYVADSKLCSRQNLDHIHGNGGKFICVLPKSRKEDHWFRRRLQTHPADWAIALDRSPENESRPVRDVWMATQSPNRSAEGYRIIWVLSLRGAEHDKSARAAAIKRACDGIEHLDQRLQSPKSRLRDRPSVAEAAEQVIAKAGASRWVKYEIAEHMEESYRQAAAGRPGPNTKYTRTEKIRFSVSWKEDAAAIAYDAVSDGMYPLITNCEHLSPEEVLIKHKYQPTLEKRHEQLKTVYSVAPTFLKNEGRVEALLLLYYAALLVQALIERQLRNAMKKKALSQIPLYPEERECRSPTARKVFDAFATIQRHHLWNGETLERIFEPKLSSLQRQLLGLLGVPEVAYLAKKQR